MVLFPEQSRTEKAAVGWYLRFGKRLADCIAACVGCVILSPLMLVAVLGILFESQGPIIFKQERLGLNGKVFILYKFRSMRMDAEAGGPTWTKRNDNRVTKFGHFLRKYHIDELPQLINILRGDMSWIGPRPERAYFYHKFGKDIPEFLTRLAVKPGLTGWAQVNGGYDIGPKEKFLLDKQYIAKQSLRLDVVVLLKTVSVVLKGNGAR
ncbi:MAG TPA: UDP-phosphate N-acetylgalactosaminyl-1-phosphate transferase [Ruminococcaceae bacterium]|nr:UDP-phosphate N-acetylgalactosaminyl-1-phosphate transferase [Oscillospiraceae bacterium]